MTTPELVEAPAGRGFATPVPATLMARARRGTPEAIAELYRLFGGHCYNLALRLSGHPSAAEDIVHEVFLTLLNKIRAMRNDAAFGGWLKRICINQSIDWLRGRQLLDMEVEREAALPEDSASAALVAPPEVQHDLMRLLLSLPAPARAVLLLHQLEGYTHGEIAELFGMTESFSKSLLARTLKRLQGQQTSSESAL